MLISKIDIKYTRARKSVVMDSTILYIDKDLKEMLLLFVHSQGLEELLLSLAVYFPRTQRALLLLCVDTSYLDGRNHGRAV